MVTTVSHLVYGSKVVGLRVEVSGKRYDMNLEIQSKLLSMLDINSLKELHRRVSETPVTVLSFVDGVLKSSDEVPSKTVELLSLPFITKITSMEEFGYCLELCGVLDLYTTSFRLPNSCFSDNFNISFYTSFYDTYGEFPITHLSFGLKNSESVFIPVCLVLEKMGKGSDFAISRFKDGRGHVCDLVDTLLPFSRAETLVIKPYNVVLTELSDVLWGNLLALLRFKGSNFSQAMSYARANND